MKKALAFALVLIAGISAAALERTDWGRVEEQASSSFSGNVDYDGRIVFARIRFDTGFGPGFGRARGSRGEPPWAHDYPTSDTHLRTILRELTVSLPRTDGSNVF